MTYPSNNVVRHDPPALLTMQTICFFRLIKLVLANLFFTDFLIENTDTIFFILFLSRWEWGCNGYVTSQADEYLFKVFFLKTLLENLRDLARRASVQCEFNVGRSLSDIVSVCTVKGING